MRLEWEERRDAFPALLAAQQSNQGKKEGERLTTLEDILTIRYPKKSKAAEHDPDRGAAGDWEGLKTSLQEVTQKRKRVRANRPKAVK